MPRGGSRADPLRSDAMIALVAAAVLLYEIAITRLLSVVVWYHFAFLAVSLAMLGLGAPGVWYALRPPGPSALRRSLVLAGAAVPLSIVSIVKAGEWAVLYPGRFPLAWLPERALLLSLVIVSVLVPMLLLGSAVCLLLLEAPGRRLARRYGADLLGATAGALAVVPLLSAIPTPALLVGVGFLPLLAALLRFGPSPAALLTAAGLVGLLLWGEPLELRYSKLHVERGVQRLYEKWTPTGRLTVFPMPGGPQAAFGFGWGMGWRYEPVEIEQLWIEQDGSAATPITRLDGSPSDLDFLDYDVTSAGYQLRPPRQVCIVGAGGGRDILAALRAGAERVDAVEINPQMIRLVQERFGDFSGGVYGLPRVEAHASEGRSFLVGSDRRYDLIQISLIDSWAATAAGAFALSESYLYTVEAMRLYWSRLSETGLLSVSRWMMDGRPLEAVRLAGLAAEALSREGVDPLAHVAVLQAGRVATLLISRSPLDATDGAQLHRVARERGFLRHWPPPHTTRPEPLLIRALRGEDVLVERGVDLSPPTDDRPFFFQMVGVFRRVDSDLAEDLSVNDRSVLLLRFLLGALLGASALLFFAPFALAGSLPRHPGFWRGSGYFAAIGLAFMLVEAPWIQTFILYLGHPSYATTVVVAALLLGAGLGATAAGRIPLARVGGWRFALPVAIAAANAALPGAFESSLGWSLPLRALLCLGVLLPLGFGMGMAFPLGMIAFGDGDKAWFWAMNGAFGVLASVASLALAMAVGLTSVVWMGVAAYAVAGLLLPRR